MNCPACGFDNDAYVEYKQEGPDVDSREPSCGDALLCYSCAAVLTLNEEGELVYPSQEQRMRWVREPLVQQGIIQLMLHMTIHELISEQERAPGG
jgi:hypothetical protein